MFKYFILRKQQQLFCYFCGIVLAMVLMLLFPSVFRRSIGAVELDDASHLKKHRIRRDILLEEVLRQAGIPLLRDRDSERLVRRVGEFLKNRGADAA